MNQPFNFKPNPVMNSLIALLLPTLLSSCAPQLAETRRALENKSSSSMPKEVTSNSDSSSSDVSSGEASSSVASSDLPIETSSSASAESSVACVPEMQPINPKPKSTPDDRAQECAIVNSLLSNTNSDAIQSAVRLARSKSKLSSSINGPGVETRLGNLLRWIVKDYRQSKSLRLLSNSPTGANAKGDDQLALKQMYWLMDNNDVGAAALSQYTPPLGRILEDSWRGQWPKLQDNWQQLPDQLCIGNQPDIYTMGRLPFYDRAVKPNSACAQMFKAPSDTSRFRMAQVPAQPTADCAYDPSNAPCYEPTKKVIGTVYVPIGSKGPVLADVNYDSARDLLKYDCLRQALKGNKSKARLAFARALDLWDGSGFKEPKNQNADLALYHPGIYWTRDLAFALACANALGLGQAMPDDPTWGMKNANKEPIVTPVTKGQIEAALWAQQVQIDSGSFHTMAPITNASGEIIVSGGIDPVGGMWSGYCKRSCNADGKCRCADVVDATGTLRKIPSTNGVPYSAKETQEISTLVLLVYGKNIWARDHK